MPSEWSFTIVVEPQYADLPPSTNNNDSKKHAAVVVPLGPKQPVITIPIDISFNVTRMSDPHHNGC